VSDQTKAAMDAAIAAHVADETAGDIIAGYVMQVTTTSVELMDEEKSGFIRFCAEHQTWVTTLGLTDYMRVQQHRAMLDSEDD
jgi:hypothetical protein